MSDSSLRYKSLWTFTDSAIAVVLLGIIAAVYKNMSVFYLDYETGLEINFYQYAYIIAAQYIGQFTSVAFSSLIEHFFSTSLQIAIFNGMSAAIFVLFLPFAYFMENEISRVIWFVCCLWFFGNCVVLFLSNIIQIACDHSLPSKRGRVLSYLEFYWVLATLFYLPVSYMINDVSVYLPFITFGSLFILLIVPVFHCRWKEKFNDSLNMEDYALHDESDSDSSENSTEIIPESVNTWAIFCDIFINAKECRLVLLCTIFSSVSRQLWENTLSGLWFEEYYGWSTTDVGWFSFVIFFGEIIGTFIPFMLADKFSIISLSFAAFLWIDIIFIIVFILSVVIGIEVGGVWVAIVVNFGLYFISPLIYVSQIMAIMKYRPSGNAERTAVVAFFSFYAIGKFSGSLITADVWNNDKGLTWLCLICSLLYLVCILLWVKIYHYSTQT